MKNAAAEPCGAAPTRTADPGRPRRTAVARDRGNPVAVRDLADDLGRRHILAPVAEVHLVVRERGRRRRRCPLRRNPIRTPRPSGKNPTRRRNRWISSIIEMAIKTRAIAEIPAQLRTLPSSASSTCATPPARSCRRRQLSLKTEILISEVIRLPRRRMISVQLSAIRRSAITMFTGEFHHRLIFRVLCVNSRY